MKRWIVVSTQTTKRYFEGIEAESEEDAMRQWEAGEGEISLTESLPWEQQVEEVKP